MINFFLYDFDECPVVVVGDKDQAVVGIENAGKTTVSPLIVDIGFIPDSARRGRKSGNIVFWQPTVIFQPPVSSVLPLFCSLMRSL